MLGVAPHDLRTVTLAMLVEMEEARQMAAWDHTAMLAYLLAESNRNAKKRSRPYTVAEFHPYRRHKYTPRGDRITADNIETLKCFLPHDGELAC